jgi:hypothetical protein
VVAAPPSGTYVMCAIPYRITASTTVRYTVYRNGVATTTGSRTYATSAPADTAWRPREHVRGRAHHPVTSLFRLPPRCANMRA